MLSMASYCTQGIKVGHRITQTGPRNSCLDLTFSGNRAMLPDAAILACRMANACCVALAGHLQQVDETASRCLAPVLSVEGSRQLSQSVDSFATCAFHCNACDLTVNLQRAIVVRRAIVVEYGQPSGVSARLITASLPGVNAHSMRISMAPASLSVCCRSDNVCCPV